jgi:hypothetical protein
MLKGQWSGAIEVLRSNPGLQHLLAFSLARSGQENEARRMRDKAIADWNRSKRGALGIAIMSAGLHDNDGAFDWLERSVEDLTGWAEIMHPIYDELHADPRFAQFLARRGLQKR